MNLTFPSDTLEVINAIREAIGREVTFYTKTVTPCTASGCSLDPITQTSTNSFCPVCSGLYYIPTFSGIGILAHVTWGKADQMGWATAGQFVEGDCRLSIENSVENLGILVTTAYIDVDNRKMKINKQIPRGVPEINRIILDLSEEDDDLT